jgi:hypothetical protein
MTKSALAVLYARLGQARKALELFKKGFQPNQRPPFGTLAESADSANPYFATAAGGLLQSVLYGWGGLEITDDGLIQRPVKLPDGWKSLTMTGVGPQRSRYVGHYAGNSSDRMRSSLSPDGRHPNSKGFQAKLPLAQAVGGMPGPVVRLREQGH